MKPPVIGSLWINKTGSFVSSRNSPSKDVSGSIHTGITFLILDNDSSIATSSGYPLVKALSSSGEIVWILQAWFCSTDDKGFTRIS